MIHHAVVPLECGYVLLANKCNGNSSVRSACELVYEFPPTVTVNPLPVCVESMVCDQQRVVNKISARQLESRSFICFFSPSNLFDICFRHPPKATNTANNLILVF